MITNGLEISNGGEDINIEYKDYADEKKVPIRANFYKKDFGKLSEYPDCVSVVVHNKIKYMALVFDPDNPDCLKVSKVGGVVPTDIPDLYQKIKALR